ncbi:MAG: enoyl-CoA hydratase/isomerase family protein [Pseudomonadota bacterium]|nr:enoyl-CoA hydratase/isomerase family protein [Pseudomonadota bacterium]
MSTSLDREAGEVLCEVRNHTASITLNRPAALNALSMKMIDALQTTLARCAADGQIRAVLLRGAGDKAFCAGGDIRALYQSYQHSGTLHHEFFIHEYRLDYLLHRFPKPCLALLDGITMGGGMGLAQAAMLRIVGERTRIAMPEVGIGLFPDVGASYFLSRLPGLIGPYLALTGTQIRGIDALYCGLADAYLSLAGIESLEADLATLAWSDNHGEDLRRLVTAHSANGLPAPPLSTRRSAIDRHFSRPDVTAIIESLEADRSAEHGEWAQQTAKLMRGRSPTMLAVTLRQLELGRSRSLAECFRMELGMVERCFEQGDFIEGIRALLIDKDNAPRWTPGDLQSVDPAAVEAFFRDPWHGAQHPLADLAESHAHA